MVPFRFSFAVAWDPGGFSEMIEKCRPDASECSSVYHLGGCFLTFLFLTYVPSLFSFFYHGALSARRGLVCMDDHVTRPVVVFSLQRTIASVDRHRPIHSLSFSRCREGRSYLAVTNC